MTDWGKSVFISYRRSKAWSIARLVWDDLGDNDYDVFMDVESIDSGIFDLIISKEIAERAHFVLILTPGTWERRIDSRDWLRREIILAMDLKRNIVPVLVDGLRFSDVKPYLTGKLKALPRINSLSLSNEYFSAAMEKLRSRFLNIPTGTVLPPRLHTEAVPVPAISDRLIPLLPQVEGLPGAEVYYLRGTAYYNLGDYDNAIKDYTQAIVLNPLYAEAYFNRGKTYLKQMLNYNAILDFNQAIQLNPQLSQTGNLSL